MKFLRIIKQQIHISEDYCSLMFCFNLYFYLAYKIPPLSERCNLFQSLLSQQENGIQKKKSIDGGGVNINQRKGDAENSWSDRAPEINERGDI